MRYIFLLLMFLAACATNTSKQHSQVLPGAYQIDEYLPLLKGKNVALVVNHTSLIDETHLLDTLLSLGIKVNKIFAPEHGFRGKQERGIEFKNSIDPKTGIPIISLIGKKKKPTSDDLKDVDILVYDIQDVGVRFFTYISTMYYVMEAAAENNIPMIILDRPNPNGDYVDGPVLDLKFRSFVGMLPIPVVYGLTPGELALMINGENWLPDGLKTDLTIVKIKNYTHHTKYVLPVKPSPNLPNYLSVRLYPSLCFFEATDFSVGRGTYFPFQVIGYPDKRFGDFTFVPKDIPSMQTNPIHEGETCYGIDLRNLNPDTVKFSFHYVIKFYKISNFGEKFFSRPRWFDLLAGTDKIRKAILQGKNTKEIEQLYKAELEDFKQMRKKYLLYSE